MFLASHGLSSRTSWPPPRPSKYAAENISAAHRRCSADGFGIPPRRMRRAIFFLFSICLATTTTTTTTTAATPSSPRALIAVPPPSRWAARSLRSHHANDVWDSCHGRTGPPAALPLSPHCQNIAPDSCAQRMRAHTIRRARCFSRPVDTAARPGC